MEFGERRGDATDYANLRVVFQSLAKYERAQEYHEKALAMRMEIGDRKGETAVHRKFSVTVQKAK